MNNGNKVEWVWRKEILTGNLVFIGVHKFDTALVSHLNSMPIGVNRHTENLRRYRTVSENEDRI